jgi:hypothetical protein
MLTMDMCYRHPDRPGTYFCQKDGNRMCEECACCHSPRIYCQHRGACVINMLTKQGELTPCEQKSDESQENSEIKMSATG